MLDLKKWPEFSCIIYLLHASQTLQPPVSSLFLLPQVDKIGFFPLNAWLLQKSYHPILSQAKNPFVVLT